MNKIYIVLGLFLASNALACPGDSQRFFEAVGYDQAGIDASPDQVAACQAGAVQRCKEDFDFKAEEFALFCRDYCSAGGCGYQVQGIAGSLCQALPYSVGKLGYSCKAKGSSLSKCHCTGGV